MRSIVVFRDSFLVLRIPFWVLSLNVKWGFAEFFECGNGRVSRFRGKREEEPQPDLNGNDFNSLLTLLF